MIMLCMKVKRLVVRSCLILCYPMDYSSPDSYVHQILQGRILERLPFPSPGVLSDPGIEPRSAALQADSWPSEPQEVHTLYRQSIFYKSWIKPCEHKLFDYNISQLFISCHTFLKKSKRDINMSFEASIYVLKSS